VTPWDEASPFQRRFQLALLCSLGEEFVITLGLIPAQAMENAAIASSNVSLLHG